MTPSGSLEKTLETTLQGVGTLVNPENLVSLAALERGCPALIRVIGRGIGGDANGVIERRLLEIGFEEGREAEIRHLSPIGGDPIAVRVDKLNIAVRRSEAAFVLVEPLAPQAHGSGPAAGDAEPRR